MSTSHMSSDSTDPFGDVRALILKARLLRNVIRHGNQQAGRDNAIREYTHALDALLDRLGEMHDQGQLDPVSPDESRD